MPAEELNSRASIFVSYKRSVQSDAWVSLATKQMKIKFVPHDYQVKPENGPDLDTALNLRIRRSDVFVALLSKEYYDTPLTRKELNWAIEASTGSASGSLRTGQGRPLVYIVTFDVWAEEWCKKNHSSFVYFTNENYGFNMESSQTLKPALWDDWFHAINERLQDFTELQPSVDDLGLLESRLLILGRPEGKFDETTGGARDDLIANLGSEFATTVISDGWYDRRAAEVAGASRTIVKGGSRSLIVQVCDGIVSSDNRTEGDPFGSDLRAKLQRTGLERREAEMAIARTWFWTPSSVGCTTPNNGGLDRYFGFFSQGAGARIDPLFISEPFAKLAQIIRLQLDVIVVRLEAEDGIDDIGAMLNRGFRRYLDPMLFELVESDKLPLAIQRAVTERAPVLVLIHDRRVDQTRPAETQIQSRAREFDRRIKQLIAGATGLRIARAILLVRSADRFFGSSLIADETWVLLPIREGSEPGLPPDRLESIRKTLGFPPVITAGAQ
jgi:hypothetical protein